MKEQILTFTPCGTKVFQNITKTPLVNHSTFLTTLELDEFNFFINNLASKENKARQKEIKKTLTTFNTALNQFTASPRNESSAQTLAKRTLSYYNNFQPQDKKNELFSMLSSAESDINIERTFNVKNNFIISYNKNALSYQLIDTDKINDDFTSVNVNFKNLKSLQQLSVCWQDLKKLIDSQKQEDAEDITIEAVINEKKPYFNEIKTVTTTSPLTFPVSALVSRVQKLCADLEENLLNHKELLNLDFDACFKKPWTGSLSDAKNFTPQKAFYLLVKTNEDAQGFLGLGSITPSYTQPQIKPVLVKDISKAILFYTLPDPDLLESLSVKEYTKLNVQIQFQGVDDLNLPIAQTIQSYIETNELNSVVAQPTSADNTRDNEKQENLSLKSKQRKI